MANYFHRQLGYYADAHRNRVNSVMHMIGNPILFVAVVLPLSLLPVSVLGVEISAAPLLTGWSITYCSYRTAARRRRSWIADHSGVSGGASTAIQGKFSRSKSCSTA